MGFAVANCIMSITNDHDYQSPSLRKGWSSFPPVRLTETQDYLTVTALVPGFTQAELSITLSKDVLCVTGNGGAAAPRGFEALHRGRRATQFRSEIKLLSEVAWGDTNARLERGVLTIRLRKDAPDARAPIPIRLI